MPHRVVGVSMVKDEADIIAATLRRMTGQVDWMIVADNGSTDGTREILDKLACELPLTVLDDPEPGYWQSQKMTRLAHHAATVLGAEWVVPFDADEIWISRHGRVADVLLEHQQASVATAVLFDHVATGADPDWPDPIVQMGWRRREPGPLPKVAVRPFARVTIHQGNHDADHGARVDGLLEVRHFQWRTPDQMVRKVRNGARAYAATDLPEHVGQHWRELDQLSDDEIADVFRTRFWVAEPAQDPSLVFDPCPLG